MSWVLLGGSGMLGQDLAATLTSQGQEVRALGSADCDIRDLDAVRSAVQGAAVVVNCAAYTAVDAAQDHEADAFDLNATGARNAALAAVAVGARFVQISTDYVMAGTDEGPYAEDTPQRPRSAYGRTKAAGEWAVLQTDPQAIIVRTAWLYGAGGNNFVSTMLRLAGEREQLTVVADQAGQPTWTRDLADLVVRLVSAKVPGGIYHGTSSGATTWHGFAQEIFRLSGLDPQRVLPVTTADFPRPAPRPANSVLGHDRFAAVDVAAIRGWEAGLAAALPDLR
ncbi:dTDP-4-dehydrorhamnose reductase [Calidifontibacter terrae]